MGRFDNVLSSWLHGSLRQCPHLFISRAKSFRYVDGRLVTQLCSVHIRRAGGLVHWFGSLVSLTGFAPFRSLGYVHFVMLIGFIGSSDVFFMGNKLKSLRSHFPCCRV